MVSLTCCIKTFGQFDAPLAKLNYTLAPIGADTIDVYTTHMEANIPSLLGKATLTNSFNADYYQINYQIEENDFSTYPLTNFYNLKYQLSYSYPFSDHFKLESKGNITLASNLTDNVTMDDFVFGAGLYVTTKLKTDAKPTHLKFGLEYNTLLGQPKLLPIFSFYREISDDLSYDLGFPSSNIIYKLNFKSQIKASADVNGLYTNLSNPIYIDQIQAAQKASISTKSFAFDYSYKMDANWNIHFSTGFIFQNSYELLNSNNQTIYDFDTSSKVFFTTGLIFNL